MFEKIAGVALLLLFGAGAAWAGTAGVQHLLSGEDGSAVQGTVLSQSGWNAADTALFEELPWRDHIMQQYVRLSELFGNHKFGGVYVTEERFLEDPEELHEAQLQETAAAINTFYQTYEIPICMAAVPSATELYRETLPKTANLSSQLPQINMLYEMVNAQIRKIDVYHTLMTVQNDPIYYRTDTSWTAYGAYDTYRTVIQKMGYYPVPYDQFSILHQRNDFRGNLYQKCHYQAITPDILDIYLCENGNEITEVQRSTDGAHWTEGQVYDAAAVERSGVDSFYFGDPTLLLRITTNAENGQHLLVCKDSTANAMLPFLAQHYQQMDVLDLTALEEPLTELVDPTAYQQVLFLCRAQTYEQSAAFQQLVTARKPKDSKEGATQSHD